MVTVRGWGTMDPVTAHVAKWPAPHPLSPAAANSQGQQSGGTVGSNQPNAMHHESVPPQTSVRRLGSGCRMDAHETDSIELDSASIPHAHCIQGSTGKCPPRVHPLLPAGVQAVAPLVGTSCTHSCCSPRSASAHPPPRRHSRHNGQRENWSPSARQGTYYMYRTVERARTACAMG